MAPFRILQVQDLHLGRTQGEIAPSGRRVREEDLGRIAAGLIEVVRFYKPYVIAFCGDTFDSAAPSTPVRAEAYRMVDALRDEAYVLMIPGFADQGRRPAGSPLRHLAEFFGAEVQEGVGHFDIPGGRIHMIAPRGLAQIHAGTAQIAPHALSANVVMTHATVSDAGVPEIPHQLLATGGVTLVMAGGPHGVITDGRVRSAGATDRLDEAQGAHTGVLLHEVSRLGAESRLIPVSEICPDLPRPWVHVAIAAGLGPEEQARRATEQVAQAPEGAVIVIEGAHDQVDVIARAERAARRCGVSQVITRIAQPPRPSGAPSPPRGIEQRLIHRLRAAGEEDLIPIVQRIFREAA